jgi:hypothetical protein
MVAHSRTALRVDRLRALNAPEAVEVDVDASGVPRAVRRPEVVGRSRNNGGGQAVENILDVWRIDDEWWRLPISRLYYDVMLEGGGHIVLFKDLVAGAWFTQQP